MIKYTLIGVTALFLISCTQVNSNGEKTITQGDDTIGEVDISLSKWDAVEELSKIDESKVDKVLFKASGSEPGWFAEFYENKFRLLVDYGQDSLIMEPKTKFERLDRKNGYSFGMEKKDSDKDLFVQIIDKPCTDDASGEKMDRQVVIVYKHKKYTGCGSFVK